MSVATPVVVRQSGISDDLLALTTLTDVAYVDCHVLETPAATTRTAQQWARAIMEDVPAAVHERLITGWGGLRLDLEQDAPNTVCGWRIAVDSPKRVVLRANSELGFRGELVTEVLDRSVRFATFVTMSAPQGAQVWFPLVPKHTAVVRSLLEDAGRGVPAPVR